MNNKLKPCPFCGSEAILRSSENWHCYSACCTNRKCGIEQLPYLPYFDEKEAIEAWNKRSSLT